MMVFIVRRWSCKGQISVDGVKKLVETKNSKESGGVIMKIQRTKVWITMCGKCLLANNHSNIPEKALNNIIRVIEARSDDIIEKWNNFFGEGRFYC